jgi:hypothetical protein
VVNGEKSAVKLNVASACHQQSLDCFLWMNIGLPLSLIMPGSYPELVGSRGTLGSSAGPSGDTLRRNLQIGGGA